MNKDIYVIIEQVDGRLQRVSLELLCEARRLANEIGQKVIAVALGANISEELVSPLFEYGADSVIRVQDPMLSRYMTEPYTKAIVAIIKERQPDVVLFGATTTGRDLAPRIAARIHTGLTADCTGLAIDPEEKILLMTRPAFGGNLMATIVCKDYRPQMATVRQGVMLMVEPEEGRTGELIDFDLHFDDRDENIEILEVRAHEAKARDISESNVLVSAGYGVGSCKSLEVLRELAQLLEGEISASRACVDSGWISKEYQVGQTGKTVRPDLYLACGISGAVQHTVGMENAGFILAINKDEYAPIMDIADLAIVGDLHEILPSLVEAIRDRKQMQIELN